MRFARTLLLTVAFTTLLVPHAESGQAATVARIGYLSLGPGPSPRTEALQQGLRDLGYVEGTNLTIDYRWADGNLDRLQAAAAELARSQVAVIVTGGPQATRAAKEATTAIPIVMAVDYEPVGAGFAASLARPGGNITGMSAVGTDPAWNSGSPPPPADLGESR